MTGFKPGWTWGAVRTQSPHLPTRVTFSLPTLQGPRSRWVTGRGLVPTHPGSICLGTGTEPRDSKWSGGPPRGPAPRRASRLVPNQRTLIWGAPAPAGTDRGSRAASGPTCEVSWPSFLPRYIFTPQQPGLGRRHHTWVHKAGRHRGRLALSWGPPRPAGGLGQGYTRPVS